MFAQGNWNTDDQDDFTKIIYAVYCDDPADADSHKVSFHVRFSSTGQIGDTYALEMLHGNDIGSCGDVEVEVAHG